MNLFPRVALNIQTLASNSINLAGPTRVESSHFLSGNIFFPPGRGVKATQTEDIQ